MILSNLEKYQEQALVQKIAEGDEVAFAALFHSYLGRLKPFLDKISRTAADTNEIIQETFIQVWLNREKLIQVNNISAYIFKIAANQYHLSIRKEISKDKAFEKYAHSLDKTGNSIDRTLRLKELQLQIHTAVQRLPEKRKLIFQMSRNEGLTIQEIAAKLNISPKTVKNTLFAALGSIRSHLKQQEHIIFLCFLVFF